MNVYIAFVIFFCSIKTTFILKYVASLFSPSLYQDIVDLEKLFSKQHQI